MPINTKRLTEIDKASIIELLNHPMIKIHMPLSAENVGDKEYVEFIAAKESIWLKHHFGPLAYLIEDRFIGWAGIQPDGVDFELALVLHPKYWGYGKKIYKELLSYAFDELKLQSLVIYFPPSRTRIKGLLRDGFQIDGEVEYSGCRFIRYRLQAEHYRQRFNSPI